MTRTAPARTTGAPAYLAFAAFGSLWGVWGGALPQVRDQAGLTDGQLGTALLFVGVGALPAMLLTGPAVDRFGRRVPAAALVALGLAGLLVAATARGPVSASVGLAVLGATSGAADVAINTVAVDLERATGRPVITRAHGSLSTAVVAASLLTGLFAGLRAPLTAAFAVAAAVCLGAALGLLRRPRPEGARPDVPVVPLLLAGSATAAVGTALLAVAPSSGIALLGLALAAAGTAVLFPTVLKGGVGHLDEGVRGRATSVVSTTAYLGFLLGPVHVGRLADAVDLCGAMLGVAALALLFAVVVRPVLARTRP